MRAYTPTALPPVGARVAAFVAIIVGGICGGLITFAVVDLQCNSDDGKVQEVLGGAVPGATAAPSSHEPAGGCDVAAGAAGLLGAVVSAGGVSVVSVLVLRAMAEWRRNLAPHELDTVAEPDPAQRTSRSRRNPSA